MSNSEYKLGQLEQRMDCILREADQARSRLQFDECEKLLNYAYDFFFQKVLPALQDLIDERLRRLTDK